MADSELRFAHFVGNKPRYYGIRFNCVGPLRLQVDNGELFKFA